jgi:glycosyltransferase involved in cell wall biosynthesis
MPLYSIIIPAYNEGERLAVSLEAVLRFIAQERWQAEVLVVNDGSRDNTAAIAAGFCRKDARIHLVENPGNRGKGYSVRNGMTNARGDVLLFTDADLSSPIAECKKLFTALDAGADVAIGSRWLDPATQTGRQPVYRQLAGRIFNLLLRTILGLRYKDTQCGFKAFTAKAARQIFPRQRIERWGFDPEILFLARKLNLKVAEVSVAWAHDERSKISPFTDGPRMFLEMVRVRWNDWTGKYRGVAPALAAGR